MKCNVSIVLLLIASCSVLHGMDDDARRRLSRIHSDMRGGELSYEDEFQQLIACQDKENFVEFFNEILSGKEDLEKIKFFTKLVAYHKTNANCREIIITWAASHVLEILSSFEPEVLKGIERYAETPTAWSGVKAIKGMPELVGAVCKLRGNLFPLFIMTNSYEDVGIFFTNYLGNMSLYDKALFFKTIAIKASRNQSLHKQLSWAAQLFMIFVHDNDNHADLKLIANLRYSRDVWNAICDIEGIQPFMNHVVEKMEAAVPVAPLDNDVEEEEQSTSSLAQQIQRVQLRKVSDEDLSSVAGKEEEVPEEDAIDGMLAEAQTSGDRGNRMESSIINNWSDDEEQASHSVVDSRDADTRKVVPEVSAPEDDQRDSAIERTNDELQDHVSDHVELDENALPAEPVVHPAPPILPSDSLVPVEDNPVPEVSAQRQQRSTNRVSQMAAIFEQHELVREDVSSSQVSGEVGPPTPPRDDHELERSIIGEPPIVPAREEEQSQVEEQVEEDIHRNQLEVEGADQQEQPEEEVHQPQLVDNESGREVLPVADHERQEEEPAQEDGPERQQVQGQQNVLLQHEVPIAPFDVPGAPSGASAFHQNENAGGGIPGDEDPLLPVHENKDGKNRGRSVLARMVATAAVIGVSSYLYTNYVKPKLAEKTGLLVNPLAS